MMTNICSHLRRTGREPHFDPFALLELARPGRAVDHELAGRLRRPKRKALEMRVKKPRTLGQPHRLLDREPAVRELGS